MPSQLFPGAYPHTRLRRNRADGWTRRLVAEHRLSADDLIWPVFVIEGDAAREPVASMPGVDRLTVDLLTKAKAWCSISASARARTRSVC